MSEKQEQVHLVIYRHKHGEDYVIARTERMAILAAFNLAYESVVNEDRYDGGAPKLVQEFKDALSLEGKADIGRCMDVLSTWASHESDTFGAEYIDIEQHPLI